MSSVNKLSRGELAAVVNPDTARRHKTAAESSGGSQLKYF